MPAITVSAVDTAAETLTATAHGLTTGDRFRLRNIGGALPAATPSLAPVTDYFAIRVDDDKVKVATSSSNALAGTAVNLTGAGTGTHIVQYGLPYCVPRVQAFQSRVYSADLNATWNAVVSLYALLTGQSETVWSGAVTLAGALTIGGGIAGALSLVSHISPSALASGNTDDYTTTGLSTATIVRLTPDSAGSTLRGIAGGTGGRVLGLLNIGTSASLLLAHDTGGTAANRFLCPNSATVTIRPNGGAVLWYDSTSTRWRVLAGLL